MLRALCLTITVLILPTRSAAADVESSQGANAALRYWQAFANLPRLTNAEQKKLHAEYLTMPLDGHVRKIVTQAEYALKMMRRGAALRRCDWDIGFAEEGVETRLPHAEAGRLLCSLSCLSARRHFEKGRTAEAIEDLVAALTLARHLSQDGTLVGILVGYHGERRIHAAFGRYLPKLNAQQIKDLKKRVDALPPGGTPAKAIQATEAKTVDWFVRKVKEAKDRERVLAFLTQLCDSAERGRAFLKECGGTAPGVLKCAAQTRPCYARMAKMMDLPLDQFAKQWEREQTKEAANPLFKMWFPPIAKVRWRQAQADVRRALLSAALAVQLDGKDALKKHLDPVVGGSFDYLPFKGGFELRSHWKLDEPAIAKWQLDDQFAKPAVLTVGRRQP